VLLTGALFGLGMLLVRSDVLALRVFVAGALPTLVWGVFAIVQRSAGDHGVVDAVFGAVVGVVSGVRLGYQGSGVPRATL
jgi:energy-converting hydrogenase Eha subunit A